MTKTYFITAITISISFGSIAYLSLFTSQKQQGQQLISSAILAKILLTLGVIGFGFFHMAVYQICGTIVSGYYDSKNQSTEIGFWGSQSSVGNIAGFFLSNLLIYQLKLKWQVSFFLFSIINLIMAFVVYYRLQMPKQDQSYKLKLFQLVNQPYLQQKQQSVNSNFKEITQKNYNISEKSQIRTTQFLIFLKKTISSNISARYLMLVCFMMKATVYTFLMWFPIFLFSKGFANVSGYVSILFDIGAMAGGFLIGKMYKIDHQNQKHQNNAQNVQKIQGTTNQSNLSTLIGQRIFKYRGVGFIILVIIIILLFILIKVSLIAYCILTFLMGLFLGGSFNIVSSRDIFILGQKHLLQTDMLMNVYVGLGAFLVGIVQLLTAFLLKSDQTRHDNNTQANYGLFFVILFVLMVGCGILMFLRTFSEKTHEEVKQNQKQEIKNVQQ